MKKLIYPGIIVLALIIFAAFLNLSFQAHGHLMISSASAQSGTSSPPSTVLSKSTTVNCSLAVNVITNADGTKQAQYSWSISPGTWGYINNGGGFVQTDTGTNAQVSPILLHPTTYTLYNGNGIATSTCSATATP